MCMQLEYLNLENELKELRSANAAAAAERPAAGPAALPCAPNKLQQVARGVAGPQIQGQQHEEEDFLMSMADLAEVRLWIMLLPWLVRAVASELLGTKHFSLNAHMACMCRIWMLTPGCPSGFHGCQITFRLEWPFVIWPCDSLLMHRILRRAAPTLSSPLCWTGLRLSWMVARRKRRRRGACQSASRGPSACSHGQEAGPLRLRQGLRPVVQVVLAMP